MEILFTLLVIALFFVWLMRTERNEYKEKLERKDKQIRHLTGKYNEEDRREAKRIKDTVAFEIIIQEMEPDGFVSYDIDPKTGYDRVHSEIAKGIFKEKYGYEYRP